MGINPPEPPKQPAQPAQSKPPAPLQWTITKGAKQLNIPNIIFIYLFRHYEKHLKTYQTIAIGYTDQARTQLTIYEAEELGSYNKQEGVYEESEGLAISPFFKHWFIETIQYRDTHPCLLTIVKIENDLILMTYEEFRNHQGSNQGH